MPIFDVVSRPQLIAWAVLWEINRNSW